MRLVVDASAAIEFLLKTQLGLHIAALVDDAVLLAPELLDAEVLAVLRREVLAGRLTERRAVEALDDLRDWGVERCSHLALLATAWSFRHNVSGYDALYLATAKLNHAAVLTADGPLSRAPVTGLVIQNARIG